MIRLKLVQYACTCRVYLQTHLQKGNQTQILLHWRILHRIHQKNLEQAEYCAMYETCLTKTCKCNNKQIKCDQS